MFSPLFHRHSFSIEGYGNSIGSALSLFKSCCPSAVLFGITFVIIDAVYLQMCLIAIRHFGNKVMDIMPVIANNYSSFAVTIISIGVLIIASLHHAFPYTIKRVVPDSMFCNFFPLQASTTTGWSPAAGIWLAQAVNSYKDRLTTTIALALGVSSFLAVVMFNDQVDNSKFTKFVTNFNNHNLTSCFPNIISGIAG